MTSRAASRLFVRKIRIDLPLTEKQYIYSILNPAFVNIDNVSEKQPALELVTIANTSVKLAVTLLFFNRG